MWDDAELDEAVLRAAVVAPAGGFAALDVLDEIGSTNTELAQRARAGAADRTVLLAENQTAGRGRHARRWTAPARSGITLSVLLRPTAPPPYWGWVPLLTGLAMLDTVRERGKVDAALKWPNDVLVDGRKVAGILAEVVPGPGIVVGVGLNVTLRRDDLPVPQATSLAIEGSACTDRTELAVAFLRRFDELARAWDTAGGEPARAGLLEPYREHCATLGSAVSVELPVGEVLRGVATDVDGDGRLLVAPERGGPLRALSVGDVTHLRPA